MTRRIALSLAGIMAMGDMACATSKPGSADTGTTTTAMNTTPSINTLTAVEQREGWRLLFDGTTTSGWRNYKKQDISPGWQVVDGLLVRSGENPGDIVTNDKFRNFDLVLDWRVAEGGNSGIFYRGTEEGGNISESASEMQVLDDERHADGKSPLTSAGANYALYPAPRGVVRPAGQWNTARVLANGSHIEHWLNGVKLLEYEIGSDEWKDRVAKSKFATMPLYGKAAEGHIGLQDHGDRVEYRNLRIRVLP